MNNNITIKTASTRITNLKIIMKKIVGLVSSQTNYFRIHQIGKEMMLGNDPI